MLVAKFSNDSSVFSIHRVLISSTVLLTVTFHMEINFLKNTPFQETKRYSLISDGFSPNLFSQLSRSWLKEFTLGDQRCEYHDSSKSYNSLDLHLETTWKRQQWTSQHFAPVECLSLLILLFLYGVFTI